MSDVRKWLETIGLAQYADIFESNDLDIDLLRQVDDQILKDIDVSSAGRRLRVRNAIANLRERRLTCRERFGGGKMKDLLDLTLGIC